MIRKLATLALLLASAGHAAAQAADTPKLRELVTVSGDVVRIGDLVENAGPAAGVAVFRAPDLGQTGTVSVVSVVNALQPHDIEGLNTNSLSEVVVTRLSRTITRSDIEERIARAVAGQYGFGEARNLSVTIDRDVRTMHVEQQVSWDLTVARLQLDPRSGRFDIWFDLAGSAAARRLPLRFTGHIMEMVEAVTLTRTIGRGEIIRPADVAVERRPKAEVASDVVVPEQAIGFSTRRAMRAGMVLRPSDLIKLDVVNRNESVTITYDAPGIALTLRGKATEPGGVGDIINVLNMQSNRTVQATVAGPGRVIIGTIKPVVAQAPQPTAVADAAASEK
ncbi:MAG: flagellar basal body P-ring formation chaperone FlgA [Pseudomonadota bacterium]